MNLYEILNKVHHSECVAFMKTLPDNCIDSIVTDPPYHLVSIVKRFGGANARNTPSMDTKEGGVFARKAKGFMGKERDGVDENGIGIAQSVEMRGECLRILKPGGHLLSFSGTRTYHRIACAIEDAGFEIRNQIYRVFGSGFPKSLNIGKQKGCEDWNGRGTGLKPAVEPICMARKPLSEKTVASNCLKWGTGGINIDESRVGTTTRTNSQKAGKTNPFTKGLGEIRTDIKNYGRFPANLILSDCEEVRECFPETKSVKAFRGNGSSMGFGGGKGSETISDGHNDSGNASRFFKSILYHAKASKSERNKGCEGLEEKQRYGTKNAGELNQFSGKYGTEERKKKNPHNPQSNNHPTVKPIALMEYLIKMVTREGGIVFDPFTGSGTTLVAAKKNGFQYLGTEMTDEYIPIIEARLNATELEEEEVIDNGWFG